MLKPKSRPHTKTIKQQLEDFEQLIAWFDSDDFELEAAMEKYVQAENLAQKIEDQLAKVKNDIQVIKQKFDV